MATEIRKSITYQFDQPTILSEMSSIIEEEEANGWIIDGGSYSETDKSKYNIITIKYKRV